MVGDDRTAAHIDTSFGVFGVEATARGVVRIRLPGDCQGAAVNGSVVADDGASPAAEVTRSAASQVAEYVRGERETFDVPLHWASVADEQRRVLETLVAMAPYGRTVTYGELGAAAGVDDPRDVGVHMNRNPFPIVVPCHRVIASDGLGGYGGGLALKRRLLELEGALPPSLDLGGL